MNRGLKKYPDTLKTAYIIVHITFRFNSFPTILTQLLQSVAMKYLFSEKNIVMC